MSSTIQKLGRFLRPTPSDGREELAELILAAREDPQFKAQVLALLQLPQAQREPLVRTAVEEMRLRNESAETRAAFARLATAEGARTALRLLESE